MFGSLALKESSREKHLELPVAGMYPTETVPEILLGRCLDFGDPIAVSLNANLPASAFEHHLVFFQFHVFPFACQLLLGGLIVTGLHFVLLFFLFSGLGLEALAHELLPFFTRKFLLSGFLVTGFHLFLLGCRGYQWCECHADGEQCDNDNEHNFLHTQISFHIGNG
jgi:hypothetical protein